LESAVARPGAQPGSSPTTQRAPRSASPRQRGNPRPAAGREPSHRRLAATAQVSFASWCSLPSPKATRSLGWDSRAGDTSCLHHSLGVIVLDPSAIRPLQRLLQPLRPELQRETLLVGVPRDATPALGERLGVTVRAARRDLLATRHRVPGRLRPLDCAVVGQGGYSFGLGEGCFGCFLWETTKRVARNTGPCRRSQSRDARAGG
jgi:hypothetical protein